jgi:hypothetical protein
MLCDVTAGQHRARCGGHLIRWWWWWWCRGRLLDVIRAGWFNLGLARESIFWKLSRRASSARSIAVALTICPYNSTTWNYFQAGALLLSNHAVVLFSCSALSISYPVIARESAPSASQRVRTSPRDIAPPSLLRS